MNIQDAIRKRSHKKGREQPHIPSQTNQIHIEVEQNRHNLPVINLAFQPLRRNHPRRNPPLLSPLNPRSPLPVADHHRNLRPRQSPSPNAIGQRLKIRPPPTQQHPNPLSHKQRNLAHKPKPAKWPVVWSAAVLPPLSRLKPRQSCVKNTKMYRCLVPSVFKLGNTFLEQFLQVPFAIV